MTEESILEAAQGLLRLLPQGAVRGRTFLDIGCGSRLSTLAALQLGAASVKGINYGAESVHAARTLLTDHTPSDAWSAVRKSVFDLNPDDDGSYETVYSWGVIHHTAAVWRTIECASRMASPDGHFVIAPYRKTPLCTMWKPEKRLYANASAPVQSLTCGLRKGVYRAALLSRFRNPSVRDKNYRSARVPLHQLTDF